MTLLQEEMRNVVDHFSGQHATFSNSLKDATISPLSLEEKGKNIFLKMKLLSLEGQLLEVKRLFEGHIGEVPLPNFIFDQNSIPLQDDENEADEVSESLLSLPETEEDEVDSETDCESDCDDTDSAFFSSSGILL